MKITIATHVEDYEGNPLSVSQKEAKVPNQVLYNLFSTCLDLIDTLGLEVAEAIELIRIRFINNGSDLCCGPTPPTMVVILRLPWRKEEKLEIKFGLKIYHISDDPRLYFRREFLHALRTALQSEREKSLSLTQQWEDLLQDLPK